MSSRHSRARHARKPLENRSFYIFPDGGTEELRDLITSNGGSIDELRRENSIFIINQSSADKVPHETALALSSDRHAYKDSIVQALIMSPDALEDDEHISQYGPETREAPLEQVSSLQSDGAHHRSKEHESSILSRNVTAQRARLDENKKMRLDSRRVFQPAENMLTEEEREWLGQSEQMYLSKSYTHPVPEDSAEENPTTNPFLKVIKPTPPCLSSAPYSNRTGESGGQPLRDLFWAPPIALSDCVRAADPADRNFMCSEDFAILIWFVRTIPYCSEGEFGPYRWNWARTHGICLRSINSVQERWRKHVSKIYEGEIDMPPGTFRVFCAQSGFFYFVGNKIVGHKIVPIKTANKACIESRELNPDLDPHCRITEADHQKDADIRATVQANYQEDLHEGEHWLPGA